VINNHFVIDLIGKRSVEKGEFIRIPEGIKINIYLVYFDFPNQQRIIYGNDIPAN